MKMDKRKQPKYGYMCKTDYLFFMSSRGPPATEIYNSLDKLTQSSDCWDECGIVKVKLELVEVIEKGSLWEDV